jgi:hypothetical protein
MRFDLEAIAVVLVSWCPQMALAWGTKPVTAPFILFWIIASGSLFNVSCF